MKFSENLYTLRKEKGLTAKELANIFGFMKNTVYAWEKERSQPNFETLIKLADFFQVSVGYLVGAEDEDGRAVPSDLTEKEQRLLKLFSLLSDIEQDKLIADAEFFAQQRRQGFGSKIG